jgi:hypothetical protein
MGEGGTSAAEKEKTGHHAWVSHLLEAAAARYPVAFDRHTSRQWRTNERMGAVEVFLSLGIQHLRAYHICSNWTFCVLLMKSMQIFLLISTVTAHYFVLSVVTPDLSVNKFSHRNVCRSQRPRGPWHELSSLARTLAPWFRIPLKASMSASILCVGSSFVTGWCPVQGVLLTVCRIKKLKWNKAF